MCIINKIDELFWNYFLLYIPSITCMNATLLILDLLYS